MKTYDIAFKVEAVKLSDEIGLATAAKQLGIPYHTLSTWRQKRTHYGEFAHVGSGNLRIDPRTHREIELEKENAELKKANEILKDALGFFAKDRKK